MKNGNDRRPFPWHESPLANPMFWAGAFEVLTYTQAFHYSLGSYLHPTHLPGKGLSVRCKYVATDPEHGFEFSENILVTIPLSALEPTCDEESLDYLVGRLRDAIDERVIFAERTRWLDEAARDHRQIEAHNQGLDAYLRGTY